MKKKILIILGVFPVGAILLSACGPIEGMNDELALDQVSDNIFGLSEYGHCNDAWDNDGNGLVDMHDPNCHINPGPLRDLSLFDFPQGHNFFPDVSKIFPGGPGWNGNFRNPEQMTRWFRFLTEPDGNVAGIDLYSPGVNPEVVPIPAPLPAKILQGTAAQGNNNNLSLRGLHHYYLDHGFLPPPPVPVALDQAPVMPVVNPLAEAGKPFFPYREYARTRGRIGFPGQFYRSFGPFGGNGSQGALNAARTGNPF
jgi:hypothetical protein